jgi:hypothetical protein
MIEREYLHSLSRAQSHDASIDYNAANPSRELGVPRKRSEMRVGFPVCRLHFVDRIVSIAKMTKCEAQRSIPGSAHQLLESFVISGLC